MGKWDSVGLAIKSASDAFIKSSKSEKDVVGDITLLVSTNVRGQLDPCG